MRICKISDQRTNEAIQVEDAKLWTLEGGTYKSCHSFAFCRVLVQLTAAKCSPLMDLDDVHNLQTRKTGIGTRSENNACSAAMAKIQGRNYAFSWGSFKWARPNILTTADLATIKHDDFFALCYQWLLSKDINFNHIMLVTVMPCDYSEARG